jgi:hypothetical protein
MTQRDGSQQAYSVAVGTNSTNYPIIDQRDPTPNDIYYPIGKFWINQAGITLWYLLSQSNISGALQSTWEEISVNGILNTLSDTVDTVVHPSLSTGTPPFNIQLVSANGNLTIISNPLTNSITFTVTNGTTETLTGNTGGPIAPVAGNINVVGGTTIYITGTPGTLTEDVVSPINTILVGTGITTPSVPIAAGTNNTVLLGHTASSPTFGQVPNGALVNSSVTLNSGNNITVTGGGPLSLGGTASFNVTGTTNHDVQVGNSTGSLTSVPNGTAGQVLTATATDPVWTTLATGGVTSVTGTANQILASPTTGAVILSLIGPYTPSTYPAHSVLLGEGTSSISSVGPSSTTGQILQNNASNDPTYSTATYPSTTTINQILYSSAANTVTGLATGNNGVLITSSTGVPSWLANGTPGQILTATAGSPSWQNAGASSVTSVTGSNGVTASPTTGAVVVSGVNSTSTTVGVASFNATDFTVSGAGAVTSNAITVALSGGLTGSSSVNLGGTLSIVGSGGTMTGLTPDSVTGTGTSPVLPNGSGDIIVTGSGTGPNYSTGTTARSIRTVSTAVNTLEIQVQLAGTSSGLTPIANNFGVAEFNSNNFSVSAGLVTANNITINTSGSISGGGNVTLGGTLNLVGTSTAFPWSDEAGSFNASSNNGYFVTAVATATLPAFPANQDVVKIQSATASVVTILANAGQRIRVGNVLSAVAGTAKSTKIGDAMELVYRLTDTTWYANVSPVGAWGIT